MRKSVPYLFAALLTLSLVVPVHAAANPQKPGKWKVTMEMVMPGMPMKMPPVNFEVCLTEDDLKDPQKAVPNDPRSDCKVGDYKVDGNTVTWTVDCPKQKMTGTGEITFAPESYTGKMNMKMGEQEMSTKYSGKWMGACKK
ncbi:MAG: DUF3617 family protein [Acidobacteriota bacterium]